jgi:hypothetical protein
MEKSKEIGSDKTSQKHDFSLLEMKEIPFSGKYSIQLCSLKYVARYAGSLFLSRTSFT